MTAAPHQGRFFNNPKEDKTMDKELTDIIITEEGASEEMGVLQDEEKEESEDE